MCLASWVPFDPCNRSYEAVRDGTVIHRVNGHLSQDSTSDATPPRIRLGKAELMEEQGWSWMNSVELGWGHMES